MSVLLARTTPVPVNVSAFKGNNEELEALQALLQMAGRQQTSNEPASVPHPASAVDKEASGSSSDSEDEGKSEEVQSIFQTIAKTGRLPCATFHRDRCTLSEKDIVSKKYFVDGQSGPALSASRLVRLYGPKGGVGSRNDEAIFIRRPGVQAGDLNRADLYTQGEWLTSFGDKMYELERLWQGKSRSKGEKRKRIPEEIPQRQSTVKEAVRKVTSEKETSSEDVPVEAATHMRAELPDDVKDERPPSRNSDEVLPEGLSQLDIQAQIQFMKTREKKHQLDIFADVMQTYIRQQMGS